MIFLSSTPSGPLPPCPLFVYLSAASPKDARVRTRVGGQGTTETTKEAPLVWAVSNASKSGVFSLSTIPLGVLASSRIVLMWVGGKRYCEGPGRSLGSSCW